MAVWSTGDGRNGKHRARSGCWKILKPDRELGSCNMERLAGNSRRLEQGDFEVGSGNTFKALSRRVQGKKQNTDPGSFPERSLRCGHSLLKEVKGNL